MENQIASEDIYFRTKETQLDHVTREFSLEKNAQVRPKFSDTTLLGYNSSDTTLLGLAVCGLQLNRMFCECWISGEPRSKDDEDSGCHGAKN